MNNNIIYNNDSVFCPYSHHSSSPPPPHHPFRPSSSSSSSSFTEIFVAPTPRQSDFDHLETSTHHPFFRHHHHLPSPHTQFEFDPEILSIFFQHNDHDHNHSHKHRDDCDEIFLDHHHQPSLDLPLNNNTIEDYSFDASETITNYMDYSEKNSGSQEHPHLLKKRSSKRDRHSKITTAKGPRDRRMRLSLEVARDFFGLQDMLGFDKPSKTVEWLLTQAKSEIKKLVRSFPHQLNHNFCSNSSNNTVDDLSRSSQLTEEKETNHHTGKSSKGIKLGKEKKQRSQSRKPKPVFRIVPKDSRAKARERAKERTKEKMMLQRRSSEAVVKMNNNYSNYEQVGISNWSFFETGEDSVAQSHNNNNNNHLSFQEMEEVSPNHQSTACNIEDIADNESLTVFNKWNPFFYP